MPAELVAQSQAGSNSAAERNDERDELALGRRRYMGARSASLAETFWGLLSLMYTTTTYRHKDARATASVAR